MSSFNLVFEGLAILLIILGSIIIIINIRLWNKTKLSTLKAKVFLDESFLRNNFIIFSVIGLSLAYHIVIEAAQRGQFTIPGSLHPISSYLYYIALLIALGCISLMGIIWYKMLKKGLVNP